jgi:medium-chain acyl-[acyl-carrier-protein] hydrolase
MDDLVPAVVDVLAPWFEKPVTLLGHCSGCWIAFEVAREARLRGLPAPERLLVAAQHGPSVTANRADSAPSDDEDALRDALDGIDPEVRARPQLLDLVLPTLRADVRLVSRRHTSPPTRSSGSRRGCSWAAPSLHRS